jgi:AcrR family transcriptional regulator
MTAAPDPAPRRTQAERSASTRARLIEAAIEALHQVGYSATSTTLVADRAGVSRGAMLHHFPTKVALMTAVVRATYEADMAAYDAVTAQIEDVEARFPAVIAAAGERFRTPYGVAQTELWNATRSDRELAEAIAPIHEELDARSLRLLKGWFLACAGDDGGAETEALNFLILAALRGMALESAFGSGADTARAATGLLQQLMTSRLAALKAQRTVLPAEAAKVAG